MAQNIYLSEVALKTTVVGGQVPGKHQPKPVRTFPFLTAGFGQRLQVQVQQST